MKQLAIAFSLATSAALTGASAFAADTYTMDPTHTWPVFEVNHLGFTTQRGRFDRTTGKVMLDMAAKKGSVEVTIDTTSLDMGFPKWNEHLSEEGFFDTAKYKTMTYKSNKLIFDGDKVVGAEGELTLLGVTRPVNVMVSNFTCGANPMTKKPLCAGDISATIKRSDFGMTKYIPAVGDEIRINVPVEAYKDIPKISG